MNVKTEVLERCERCGEPVKLKITHDGKEREAVVLARCACVEKIREREELDALAEERQTAAERKAKENRQECFNDQRTSGSRFDNDLRPKSNISLTARKYAKNFNRHRLNGEGLLICGAVGTGKTFYAACIANEIIDRGNKILFTNMSKIIDHIDADFKGKQERLESLAKYDLVIIDDFGVERLTDYTKEKITAVIDCLYRHKVPLIITSNKNLAVAPADADLFIQRISNRLIEMCAPVKTGGENMRERKAKERYKT